MRNVPISEYAELHCLSNFSFLRGASHAEELMVQARELGYAALAITDECSLAGVVRAHTAVRKIGGGIKLLIGAEFTLDCGLRLVVIARNRAGYGRLSRLITRGRRKAQKGSYSLGRADVAEFLATPSDGTLALWLPPFKGPKAQEAAEQAAGDAAAAADQGAWVACTFAGRAWIAVEFTRDGRDRERLVHCRRLGERHALPLTAAGDVHMHVRERRALQDALTAVRHGVTLAEAGERLFPNGERHLRTRERLAALYPPELLARP